MVCALSLSSSLLISRYPHGNSTSPHTFCAQDMRYAQFMAWCFSCFLLEIMAEYTTQETNITTLVIHQNPEMAREAVMFPCLFDGCGKTRILIHRF
jgi:hypothetical protein